MARFVYNRISKTEWVIMDNEARKGNWVFCQGSRDELRYLKNYLSLKHPARSEVIAIRDAFALTGDIPRFSDIFMALEKYLENNS